MSNSKLVNYVKISPNSNPRTGKISKITIHHTACNITVERLGQIFAPKTRKGSSNYGVDGDGRVGMYVEEKNRAWTSSNWQNDNVAVTIEVANSGGAPEWKVSDKALKKTIELCVDICLRNNIPKLVYTGDSRGNLTTHKMFVPTVCPGPYLESKMTYIANEVNKGIQAAKSKATDKQVQLQQYREIVQKKTNFTDETMTYLENYKYSLSLLKRLAERLK